MTAVTGWDDICRGKSFRFTPVVIWVANTGSGFERGYKHASRALPVFQGGHIPWGVAPRATNNWTPYGGLSWFVYDV